MEESDLNVLLDTLDEINENISTANLEKTQNEDRTFINFMKSLGDDLEDIPEDSNHTTNINLLDNTENSSDLNVVTPESILNEYSNLDLKNEELEAQIEEIKIKNPDIFNKIKEIEDRQRENLNIQSKLKEDLKQALIDNGQKSVKNDFWTVTYIAEHTKTTFDREKFEKKYPVLAQQFIKVSTVSDSTRWTKKK